MAVLAAMASTSVRRATAVKAGARRSWRNARVTSCRSSARYSVRRTSRSCSSPSLRQAASTAARSPKRSSASARAASGLNPCSISSRVSISRWKSSSASTSSATGARQNQDLSCRPNRPTAGIGHPGSRIGETAAMNWLKRSVSAANCLRPCAVIRVELRPPPQLRHPPVRLDQAVALHAVERRVERSLLHLERARRSASRSHRTMA